MTEPVSGGNNDYYLPDKKTASKSGQGLADPEAFLKILVAQMKYQNPMQPQDSAAFISQLTQMASMEQMYNVSRSMELMAREYGISRYYQLIGQQVSLFNDDKTITGRVGGITFKNSNPYFYLGESPGSELYTIDQLINVTTITNVNELLPYLALTGRQVTIKDGDSLITGPVEKVLAQNGSVLVRVAGSDYNAGQIIELHNIVEQTKPDPDPGIVDESITSEDAVPPNEDTSTGKTTQEPVLSPE